MSEHLLRDSLEVLIVIAVGGMLWSAITSLRSGHIEVFRCAQCDRPTSRAYPHCTRCGANVSQR